jgi:hypothetical protein
MKLKQNEAYWKTREQDFINKYESKKKQERKETVNRVVNKLGGNHTISGSSIKGKTFKGNIKRFF